jgi:hypothetical protein
MVHEGYFFNRGCPRFNGHQLCLEPGSLKVREHPLQPLGVFYMLSRVVFEIDRVVD